MYKTRTDPLTRFEKSYIMELRKKSPKGLLKKLQL